VPAGLAGGESTEEEVVGNAKADRDSALDAGAVAGVALAATAPPTPLVGVILCV
jgi:hypothetical protein